MTRPIFALRSSIFFLLFLLTSCTPIRPVAKIGLVAPFEGLYRETGYAALDTMRGAIGEAQDTPMDLLPLALDGHDEVARTRRAVEKLLADEDVAALVGPLSPGLAASVADLLSDADMPWIVPYAVDPSGGFAHPTQSDAWARGLIAAVGTAVREQGVSRLLLAGSELGWPQLSDAEWSEVAGIVVERAGSAADVDVDDALLWLGDPAEGADFLNQLRKERPDVPFWLGAQGDNPVFVQRADRIHEVYWSTWTDLAYTGWAANRFPASPSTYLIHLATNAAIGSITAKQGEPKSPGGSDWLIQLYAIEEDGVLVPLAWR